MTMHCGHERAGWKGLVIAGVSFIFPAVVITMVFAWLYDRYGQLPQVEPFIYGIKPAVIAIILGAVYRLGKKALKNVVLGVLGILTLAATLLGVHEILALFACGILGVMWYYMRHPFDHLPGVAPFMVLQIVSSASTLKILWIFFKVGALLYGSGYVLFAYLDFRIEENEQRLCCSRWCRTGICAILDIRHMDFQEGRALACLPFRSHELCYRALHSAASHCTRVFHLAVSPSAIVAIHTSADSFPPNISAPDPEKAILFPEILVTLPTTS